MQALVERPLGLQTRTRRSGGFCLSTVLGNPGTCGRRRVCSYPRIRRQSSGSIAVGGSSGSRRTRAPMPAQPPDPASAPLVQAAWRVGQLLPASTSVKAGLHRPLVPRELDRSGFALWSRRPSRLVCHQCQTNNNATTKAPMAIRPICSANSTSRSLTQRFDVSRYRSGTPGGLRHAHGLRHVNSDDA